MESPIKYYKLKTNEDIVAYEVEDNDFTYKIHRPLSFTVINEVQGGRQMLNVREWVPPIVCANDTVVLPKEYVMFSTDVKETFKEEFRDATEFLYSVEPTLSKKKDSIDAPIMLKDPSTKPN